MSHVDPCPGPPSNPAPEYLSNSLSPNRSGALRYDDQHLLIGLGCQWPQVVGPVRPAQLRGVVGLGAMTLNQWTAAFRRMDPAIAAALHRAVSATIPADLRQLRFQVHGSGPVASAIDDLLPRLGALRDRSEPTFGVTVGAPGARVGKSRLQLVVELGADQVVVGPLLRAENGPCAHCLNLRRQDVDRHWAHLRPQVLGSGLYDDEPPTAPELAHAVVGLVGLVARGIGAGRPLPPGAAMSLATPEGILRHHVWPAHPRCDCQQSREMPA